MRPANNNIINKKQLKTNVYFADDLKKSGDYNKAIKLQSRDCFDDVREFVINSRDNSNLYRRVGILYGLRRTGKTYLMYQIIDSFDDEQKKKTAYIAVKQNNNMTQLLCDLNVLKEHDYKYIFIDEVTLLEDFIDVSSILSDGYSSIDNMRFLLTGTDSLGFQFAKESGLYDRCTMFHTTMIPFHEFSRLTGINDIDQYIQYGGTLNIDQQKNHDFDDPDGYIKSSIAENIQNTLSYAEHGTYYYELRPLFEKRELINGINRIIHAENNKFVLKTIQDEFRSSDYSTARNNIYKDPKLTGYPEIFDRLDEEQIISELMERLKIVNDTKYINEYSDKIFLIIKDYLEDLDVLKIYKSNFVLRKRDSGFEDKEIFTQPGLRYAHLEELLNILYKDKFFNSLSEQQKTVITERMKNTLKGKMIEDIVFSETAEYAEIGKKTGRWDSNIEIFSFDSKYPKHFQYDMIVKNRETGNIDIYEIKRTPEPFEGQKRNLLNKEFQDTVINSIAKGYKVDKTVVLYRGKSFFDKDCIYCNINEYLNEIPFGYERVSKMLEDIAHPDDRLKVTDTDRDILDEF